MMTAKFSFQKKHLSDRGVALLFALGILSALMLLGIAFMGSSLFSRRIAENRSNGNEARLLARSTANLVAGAVMMYEANINNDYPPHDFSAVFSRVQSSDDAEGVYCELLRGYQRISSTSDAGLTDYSRLDVGVRAPYHGAHSLAQWAYVHDNDGNIIGRYAYQVLPKLTLNRINLYQMLLGGVQNQTKFTEIAESEEYSFTPQKARFGQEIGELTFSENDKIGFMTFNNVSEVSAYFMDLYASQAFASSKNDYKERAWLEANFVEGTTPNFREVAPGEFRRFNLTEWKIEANQDPWLIRFGLDKTPDNATDFIEKTLTARADLPKSNGYIGKVLYDNGDGANGGKQTTEDRGGLPFLRVIGDDAGSFSDLSGLRHQIAANFNDYCDKDSIPTSDVANASWSTSNAPSYTGNEKTLYINEIFYGVVGGFSLDANTVSLSAADIVWGAELIDIYGNDDASGNLSASGYQLTGGIDSGTAEMVLEPKITFQYNIMVNKDGVWTRAESGETKSKEITASDMSESFAKKEIRWDASEVTITDFSEGSAYKIGTVKESDVFKMSTPAPSWDFGSDEIKEILKKSVDTEELKTKYNGQEYRIEITGITVEKVQPTIKSFKLLPKNMILSSQQDGESVNVDYTDFDPRKSNPAEITITTDNKYQLELTPGSTDTFQFLVGGIEAKDPRQNLNVVYNASDNATDWSLDPKFVFLKKSDSTNADITESGATISGGTAEISATTTAALIDQLRALPGNVNRDASPKKSGDNSRDEETVTDPGWSSAESMISTAVIRNAPMKSPWELGFIHRGAQFQTINLKNAEEVFDNMDAWNSNSGTSYQKGDAGILDWIKMTGCSHSYGKINLRQYFGSTLDDPYTIRYQGENVEFMSNEWLGNDKKLLEALFRNVPDEKAVDFVRNSAGNTYAGINKEYTIDLANALENLSDGEAKNIDRRSQLLAISSIRDLFTNSETDDASQERLIGRTFNLVTVNSEKSPSETGTGSDQSSQVEPPTVFYAVIIAQTIRDVGDGTAVSSDHPDQTGSASIGKFDLDKKSNAKDNVHYDVITGEAKILVTYERNPMTGKVIIRDIENIE